jgi:hypothetical protein
MGQNTFAVGQRFKLLKDVGSTSGIHRVGMIFTIEHISQIHGSFRECSGIGCNAGSTHNIGRFIELGQAVRLCGWIEAQPITGPMGRRFETIACGHTPAHAASPFCEAHVGEAMIIKDKAGRLHRWLTAGDEPASTPQSHNLGAGIGIWNIRGR